MKIINAGMPFHYPVGYRTKNQQKNNKTCGNGKLNIVPIFPHNTQSSYIRLAYQRFIQVYFGTATTVQTRRREYLAVFFLINILEENDLLIHLDTINLHFASLPFEGYVANEVFAITIKGIELMGDGFRG